MDTTGKFAMSCEQVEGLVLDLDRDDADSVQVASALAHLGQCSRCAALQESWEAAKEQLRCLAEETVEARAPARVEMRLMQEFRAQHRKATVRRWSFLGVWALAGAAVVVAGVSWWNAQQARHVQKTPENIAANAAVDGSQEKELVASLGSADD